MKEEMEAPPSESVERPWASNDKVLFDILLQHIKGVSAAELARLEDLISAQKVQDANNKVQFDNLVASMKLTTDNAIAHCRALMNYSEQAVANALVFQQKANDMFLAHMDAREKADAEARRKHDDNDRYTLDRLYSVFPEEAAGLIALLKAMVQLLENVEKKIK